jgi:DNA polymerase (family 10)
VLAAAAESGALIEINADPHRLDLDDVHCRKARALGIPIVINPDAHSTGGFANLDYGIGVARRAGLGTSDVFNTLSLPEMIVALERRKRADRGKR